MKKSRSPDASIDDAVMPNMNEELLTPIDITMK